MATRPAVDRVENWTIRAFPRALRQAIVETARERRLTVPQVLEQGMRTWLAGEGVEPPPSHVTVLPMPENHTDLAVTVQLLTQLVQVLSVAEAEGSPGLTEAMSALTRQKLRELVERLSRHCPEEKVDYSTPEVSHLPRGPHPTRLITHTTARKR